MRLRSLFAGLAYFALVFALGMAFGTLRVTIVEPQLGMVAATLIELPLMLGLAWLICLWLVRRFEVPPEVGSRLAMGGLAFALLMAAELALNLFLLGGSVHGHFAAYREPARLVGLAGQLAFGCFPLLVARRASFRHVAAVGAASASKGRHVRRHLLKD